MAWVGGEPGARGPAADPEGRSLSLRREEKAEEREPQRRPRGEGQFRAGPRLSRAAALPAQTQGPGGGGDWRNQVVWPVMPE